MRSNEDIERWKPMHKYLRRDWEPDPIISYGCMTGHHSYCQECACDCHKKEDKSNATH